MADKSVRKDIERAIDGKTTGNYDPEGDLGAAIGGASGAIGGAFLGMIPRSKQARAILRQAAEEDRGLTRAEQDVVNKWDDTAYPGSIFGGMAGGIGGTFGGNAAEHAVRNATGMHRKHKKGK